MEYFRVRAASKRIREIFSSSLTRVKRGKVTFTLIFARETVILLSR